MHLPSQLGNLTVFPQSIDEGKLLDEEEGKIRFEVTSREDF